MVEKWQRFYYTASGSRGLNTNRLLSQVPETHLQGYRRRALRASGLTVLKATFIEWKPSVIGGIKIRGWVSASPSLSPLLKSVFSIPFHLFFPTWPLGATSTINCPRLSWRSQGDVMAKHTVSEATWTCAWLLTSTLISRVTSGRLFTASVSSFVKWRGCYNADLTVLLWDLYASRAQHRNIAWGKGPTVARHLPCVPKKYLYYT